MQPYLQQAEQDKKEYESARKLYEQDAAARARGEEVPIRNVLISEISSVGKSEMPKILKRDEGHVQEAIADPNIEPPIEPQSGSLNYSNFTPKTPEQHETDNSIDIEEFNGFQDPLEDLDLGFQANNRHPDAEHMGQWNGLNPLIGSAGEHRSIISSVPRGNVDATGLFVPEESREDISVAPTMEEALDETQSDIPTNSLTIVESGKPKDTRAIAAESEGFLAVPPELDEVIPIFANGHGSGEPTEEITDGLPLETMPVANGLPGNAIGQDDPQYGEVGGMLQSSTELSVADSPSGIQQRILKSSYDEEHPKAIPAELSIPANSSQSPHRPPEDFTPKPERQQDFAQPDASIKTDAVKQSSDMTEEEICPQPVSTNDFLKTANQNQSSLTSSAHGEDNTVAPATQNEADASRDGSDTAILDRNPSTIEMI